LGAYLTLTKEAPTTTEIELRSENVLPTFSPENIVRLHWDAPRSFSLSRDPESPDHNRYFLGSGDGRPADEEAVRSLLRLLDLASFKRTLGKGSDLDSAKLGFDQPRLEMRIDAGPRSYRIVAGGDAPAPSNGVYLRVEGTNVETLTGVVDESVVSQLAKTEQEFLGGLVFPLARSETRSLKITSEKGEVRLVPDEHAFYLQPSSAQRVEADRALVDLIFFQLARTKMETYLESPPSPPMPVRIEQKGAQGDTYVAELGAPCPGDAESILVHRTKPDELIGCASRTVLAALTVEETRLRSLTATSMSPDEIDHVIIRSDKKSLDLMRDGEGYKLLSGRGNSFSREAGDEFLKGLSNTKLALVSAPPNGLKSTSEIIIKGQVRNTALSVEKERTDHTVEARLESFLAGDTLYLRRASDGLWFSVSESDKWLFLPDHEWARERKLTSFSLTQVERVKITLPDGASWEVKRTGESLLLSDSSPREADPTLARELFTSLVELEALRFLTPERPRPETGLLHVTFDVSESSAKKTWNLWIGGRVRGGYLAWSDLTEGTFVLPYGARLPFETPLNDRRLFRISLEEQQRLSIRTDGGEILFERHGGVLRSAGGEAQDDMIEPLAVALADLRVVSAAGPHPAARQIQRGKPQITVHATSRTKESGADSTVTLHLGAATVWQRISCRTAWIEGDQETYFVEEASLSPLRELL
jgi:hypothetical protein